MKSLAPPLVNDLQLLHGMARNTRLGHFQIIGNFLNQLTDQYQLFIRHNGSPALCMALQTGTNLEEALRYYYDNPPLALHHIQTIRESSPRVCPMCGSLKSWNIDHYLPQSTHPDWSLFSLNLIPSCDCNLKRGNRLIGPGNERILHPYFDLILNQRLLSWNSVGIYPNINLTLVNLVRNPDVQFHIDEIIMNTNILGWLADKIGSFVRCPSDEIITLNPNQTITARDLENAINDLRMRKDHSLGSLNNWESVFCTGLLGDAQLLNIGLARHNFIQANGYP